MEAYASETVWRWYGVSDPAQVREALVVDGGCMQITQGAHDDEILSIEHESLIGNVASWAKKILIGAPETRQRKGLGLMLAALSMAATQGAV